MESLLGYLNDQAGFLTLYIVAASWLVMQVFRVIARLVSLNAYTTGLQKRIRDSRGTKPLPLEEMREQFE